MNIWPGSTNPRFDVGLSIAKGWVYLYPGPGRTLQRSLTPLLQVGEI
jgi:hypothetical protein